MKAPKNLLQLGQIIARCETLDTVDLGYLIQRLTELVEQREQGEAEE